MNFYSQLSISQRFSGGFFQMKLHKMKHLLPISAATITLVSNQGTADAATVYTVKKNDTLGDISIHYGVSVQAIKQANHKTND